MRNRLTAFILTGMVLGVIVGFATNIWAGGDKSLAKDVAGYYHLLADIFLHLIKMIIAPLVFSTLVAGIAHMGDSAALGRIGGRALAWFIIASLISLTLGLIFVNFFAPGEGLNLVRSGAESGSIPKRSTSATSSCMFSRPPWSGRWRKIRSCRSSSSPCSWASR